LPLQSLRNAGEGDKGDGDTPAAPGASTGGSDNFSNVLVKAAQQNQNQKRQKSPDSSSCGSTDAAQVRNDFTLTRI
jgi:hypothetical protein